MNFTPDMMALVLAGKKTQTRRPMKEGEYRKLRYSSPISRYPAVYSANNRMKWAVNEDVAICPGRGKKAVGRIRITAIRMERPLEISADDARAEGFPDREAFWDKLRSLYGADVDLGAWYWVIEFEVARVARKQATA